MVVLSDVGIHVYVTESLSSKTFALFGLSENNLYKT